MGRAPGCCPLCRAALPRLHARRSWRGWQKQARLPTWPSPLPPPPPPSPPLAQPVRLTYEERKANLKAKLAALAEADE